MSRSRLALRSITGKDAMIGSAGARTPEDSLDPPNPTPDTPANPAVGWNAPKTPPQDGITPDVQDAITQAALDRITQPVEQLAATVETLSELMREQRDREAPDATMIQLSTFPIKMRSHNRPYTALLIPGTPTATLTVQWPGLGTYTKTLTAGWNVLNVPDGTLLSINTGTQDALLIRSYTFLGNPL